jgi:hypothetical protein
MRERVGLITDTENHRRICTDLNIRQFEMDIGLMSVPVSDSVDMYGVFKLAPN